MPDGTHKYVLLRRGHVRCLPATVRDRQDPAVLTVQSVGETLRVLLRLRLDGLRLAHETDARIRVDAEQRVNYRHSGD